MVKKIVFCLLAVFSLQLFAISDKVQMFSIGYGFLKQLGTADAKLSVKNNDYTVDISARTEGLAKFFSQNRREFYRSTGKVQNGVLVPQKFVQQKLFGDKEERTTYLFDHKAKRITKIKEHFEEGVFRSKEEEPNDFYADNDILSLYFNISAQLGSIKPSQTAVFYAVGANKKDGRVDVTRPTGEKLAQLKNYFSEPSGQLYLIVQINQKIFSSEKGELFLLFTSEHDCIKAVLKDVLMFGDIKAGIVK